MHPAMQADGGEVQLCPHPWHGPTPPPDPDRKSAVTLLANESLATYTGIPEGDVSVSLIDPPALAPGTIHAGTGRGVRVTHIPTGTVAESSGQRSQLQNKAVAIQRLREHPNVQRYLVNQRCTHGDDCLAHPGTGGLHDFDGIPAGELPVHYLNTHRRDPR